MLTYEALCRAFFNEQTSPEQSCVSYKSEDICLQKGLNALTSRIEDERFATGLDIIIRMYKTFTCLGACYKHLSRFSLFIIFYI